MPFEVTCGQCHGALLVEQTGVVVACPTCGAHLAIPADANLDAHPTFDSDNPPASTIEETASPVPPLAETAGVPEPSVSPSEPGPFFSHSSPGLSELAAPASLSGVGETAFADDLAPPETPVDPAGTTDPALPVVPDLGHAATGDPEQTLIAEGSTPPSFPEEPATMVLDEVTTQSLAESVAAIEAEPLPKAPSITPPEKMATPAVPVEEHKLQIDIPPPPRREVVSKQLFFYVASYASAVTLVLIYLLYSVFTYRDHVLESLPDIEPPMQDGRVGMKTAKPQDDVPRGHVLRLGESERFGNVRVTPLKITRGPVTFQHLFGNRDLVREPSPPVYQLWLRFENVSKDQVFAPLSTPIVYKRYPDKNRAGHYKVNNFLAAETERLKKKGDIYYLFGLSETSEYAIAGQNLNAPLGPGEKLETFLPAEDSLDEITGEWTWRVFFRKGYNPRSHRGVTTVIDVRFDGNAIATDGDPPKPS